MDNHGVRYVFEHRILPTGFFEQKGGFISSLAEAKGSFLFQIINQIYIDEKMENPYSESDFDLEVFKLTEEVYGMKLKFPTPEKEPLCYSAYLFFDKDFEKFNYFCIERGGNDSLDYPFVCGWTVDNNGSFTHHNYGNCSLENHNDLIRCADIHMENMYGLKRKKEIDEVKVEDNG